MLSGGRGHSDGCSADGILRSMAEFGERAEGDGGLMRSVALRRDFQAETGPEDGNAACQGCHAGFGDAEHS